MKAVVFSLVAVAACCGAFAQTPSAAAASAPGAGCERPPNSPALLPCGPDRVLTEADLKEYVVKPGWTTRAQVKGGDSGKMFFLNFLPDGAMEAGQVGGPNIGKSWTQQGDKICRNYYRFYNGPQCGPFELKDGVLYLVDADKSRNPLTKIEFVK